MLPRYLLTIITTQRYPSFICVFDTPQILALANEQPRPISSCVYYLDVGRYQDVYIVSYFLLRFFENRAIRISLEMCSISIFSVKQSVFVSTFILNA